MIIVHFSSDLMMASTVRNAVFSASAEYRLVGNHEQLDSVDLCAASSELSGRLFVDLQDKQLSPERLRSWVEKHQAKLSKVVFYAQHVNETMLSDAKDWGIGEVITRGQFFRQVNQLIQDHLS